MARLEPLDAASTNESNTGPMPATGSRSPEATSRCAQRLHRPGLSNRPSVRRRRAPGSSRRGRRGPDTAGSPLRSPRPSRATASASFRDRPPSAGTSHSFAAIPPGRRSLLLGLGEGCDPPTSAKATSAVAPKRARPECRETIMPPIDCKSPRSRRRSSSPQPLRHPIPLRAPRDSAHVFGARVRRTSRAILWPRPAANARRGARARGRPARSSARGRRIRVDQSRYLI